MKTIATITYHRSDNFGSVLQAYALGEKLRQMGYEQFNIDYRKEAVAELYRILQPVKSKYQLVTNAYHLLHYGTLRRRQKKYESFRQKWLRLSPVYDSREALLASPPVADAYIVGSDQVWHTGIVDFDESYLLDFVKQGRKISYAASGIKQDTPEEGIGLLQKHIQSFDAVSVRENIARQQLEMGTVCADPVLLLQKQDWLKLCTGEKRKNPYMLCYFAGMVAEGFEQLTRRVAKERGLERVILMPQWRNLFRPGTNAYDTGPEDFVSLIAEADMVCTNSFHGTAFSLLLNRPFLVGQYTPFSDDRLATLLGAVGMTDREIDPHAPMLPKKLMDCDFAYVNDQLARLRNESTAWLKKAIEG